MKLADQYFLAKQELDALTKQVNALKEELYGYGPSLVHGDFAVVTVRQDPARTVFDAKAAWEHIAEHLSPQLRTATLRKFTSERPGPMVVTVKGKAHKIMEPAQ
jgi:hypothetical protein